MSVEPPVLLVEDNEDDAILIRSAYEEAGIRQPLKVVSNGPEAIRYLLGEGKYADRTVYPFPLLMLLDLKLPPADGFKVLEWLHQHPEVRGVLIIIALSGYDTVQARNKAYQLGAQAFLSKPLAYAELEAMMVRLKRDWIENEAHRPQQP